MSQEKYLQLSVDYFVDDGPIFPLFRAKLFTGKLGSHEISNILHPDHAHHLQEQALQLLVFSAIDKYLGAKPKGATERPDVFCHYNCE